MTAPDDYGAPVHHPADPVYGTPPQHPAEPTPGSGPQAENHPPQGQGEQPAPDHTQPVAATPDDLLNKILGGQAGKFSGAAKENARTALKNIGPDQLGILLQHLSDLPETPDSTPNGDFAEAMHKLTAALVLAGKDDNSRLSAADHASFLEALRDLTQDHTSPIGRMPQRRTAIESAVEDLQPAAETPNPEEKPKPEQPSSTSTDDKDAPMAVCAPQTDFAIDRSGKDVRPAGDNQKLENIDGVCLIGFGFNKRKPPPGSKDDIMKDAQAAKIWLDAHKGMKLWIIGNCDTVGSEEYNQKLGQDRADNLADAIVAAGVGITRDQIQTASNSDDVNLDPQGPDVKDPKNRNAAIYGGPPTVALTPEAIPVQHAEPPAVTAQGANTPPPPPTIYAPLVEGAAVATGGGVFVAEGARRHHHIAWADLPDVKRDSDRLGIRPDANGIYHARPEAFNGAGRRGVPGGGDRRGAEPQNRAALKPFSARIFPLPSHLGGAPMRVSGPHGGGGRR